MHKAILKTYTIGFVLSLILTLCAYFITVAHVASYHKIISHEIFIPIIITFAVTQMIAQLIFFLHLLKESRPRLNLIFFISTFSLILLVIIASIWIMQHLNYNMTPADMSKFILKDEGIHQ